MVMCFARPSKPYHLRPRSKRLGRTHVSFACTLALEFGRLPKQRESKLSKRQEAVKIQDENEFRMLEKEEEATRLDLARDQTNPS